MINNWIINNETAPSKGDELKNDILRVFKSSPHRIFKIFTTPNVQQIFVVNLLKSPLIDYLVPCSVSKNTSVNFKRTKMAKKPKKETLSKPVEPNIPLYNVLI